MSCHILHNYISIYNCVVNDMTIIRLNRRAQPGSLKFSGTNRREPLGNLKFSVLNRLTLQVPQKRVVFYIIV